MGDSPHNSNDYMIKQHELRIAQESQSYLREQNLSLLLKLNQKDKLLQRHKSEADMNTRALKKFELENHKLASTCQKLLDKGNNLEKEIALYEHDREALMEFGNEADEREQQAKSRVLELERNLQLVVDELKNFKHQKDLMIGSSSTLTVEEKDLLDSLWETLASKDDDSTHAFLKANLENESCKRLLSMWNCLKPSSHRVLSLVTNIKSLQNDKEHLRTNLQKAEEEVKLLFDENSILEKENKQLLKKYKERNHHSSGEKHTSSQSAKSNKRKSSPRTNSPVEQKERNHSHSSEKHTTSPSAKSSKRKSPRTSRSGAVERKIDFDDIDSARQPLSPLANNSPDCRIHKK
ncbi:uncharacterized protein LOC131655395 [Vicia villosa]|uniref:uncharacterized protein LOC131655395 n=1 Tax=Vicia villosa TaxID=3911 RepID=UPI00273C00D9|nr:uncharacterized protein LOC131655395 [Vicia villosa]